MKLSTLGLICTATLFLSQTVNAAAQRVISLAPHATELAYSAGLGDKIIAVSDHSDYPPAAATIERVANYQGMKLERIITLQPDLIIAWPNGNPIKELDKLRQLGFNVFETNAQTLEGIAKSVEALSAYAEDPSIGLAAAKQYRDQLHKLSQQYHTQHEVSFLYQLSASPIITVAQDGWPSPVFRFCGGRNIFADSTTPYPQVGSEQVILRQPEVIFTSRHAVIDDTLWDKWQQQIPAVAKKQVWSLNASWINRPTLRAVKALEQVCELFEKARNNR